MNCLKKILFLTLFLTTVNTKAQEKNLGFHAGIPVTDNYYTTYLLGIGFEKRPKNAIFSINTELNFFLHENNLYGPVIPFYIKFSSPKKKIRICPNLGFLFGIPQSWGVKTGLELNYNREKTYWFIKSEYWVMNSVESDYRYSPGGARYTYTDTERSLFFSTGFRFKIKKD